MMRDMGGRIGALNRQVLAICEDARRLVNELYRADVVLKDYGYLDQAWERKHASYTDLMRLKNVQSGLVPLLRKICQLGGPYYSPPNNLWKYVYFFWFDPDSVGADGKSVTPEPYGDAPDFHKMFCRHPADIGLIMESLKEEFSAPELDQGESNMALVADIKALSFKAAEYWKSRSEDVLQGSTTTDKSAGLYVELLEMEEVAMKKISSLQSSGQICCRLPILLKNAIRHFKKEKEKEKGK